MLKLNFFITTTSITYILRIKKCNCFRRNRVKHYSTYILYANKGVVILINLFIYSYKIFCERSKEVLILNCLTETQRKKWSNCIDKYKTCTCQSKAILWYLWIRFVWAMLKLHRNDNVNTKKPVPIYDRSRLTSNCDQCENNVCIYSFIKALHTSQATGPGRHIIRVTLS